MMRDRFLLRFTQSQRSHESPQLVMTHRVSHYPLSIHLPPNDRNLFECSVGSVAVHRSQVSVIATHIHTTCVVYRVSGDGFTGFHNKGPLTSPDMTHFKGTLYEVVCMVDTKPAWG